MRTVIVLLFAMLLTACSTSASKVNSIHVGMSRSDVVSVLGEPVSTGAEDGMEILNYKLAENFSDYSHSFWGGQPYYVRLRDGKVVAYGRR